jgi:hypothetical protein
VLGSFDNSIFDRSLNTAGLEVLRRPRSRTLAKETQKPTPDQLLEHEWSELPYAMMRISAARRHWDGKHVYWRDRTVQLGDIDLKLTRTASRDGATSYTATYSLEDRRRHFTLQPLLEDGGPRWSAPELSDVKLTTTQLGEKLLAKLVTFYATGLLPVATSSASPGLSS